LKFGFLKGIRKPGKPYSKTKEKEVDLEYAGKEVDLK
jgi:hypothetical protein